MHIMSEKQIHFRVSEEEAKKLENYAKKTKRTKTDIVREFLRSSPWEVGYEYCRMRRKSRPRTAGL